MTEMNVPLLRKTFEHIEAHPEDWYQHDWVVDRDQLKDIPAPHLRRILSAIEEDTGKDCGTAYCFAGWACAINGDEFRLENWHDPTVCSSDYPVGVYIDERAQELLGLSGIEADSLFEATNNLSEIRSLLTDWGVL